MPPLGHAIDRRTGERMCSFAGLLTDAPGDDAWESWRGERCLRCAQAVDEAID